MDILHYIGVDYHPYQQTVAFVDQHGEVRTRRFYHTEKAALRKFYQQFAGRGVVGVEATGAMQWFVELLAECRLELRLGNPRMIRRMALSPHKNDDRDARHLLDLLLSGRFPQVQPRTPHSQTQLGWLNYRNSLVRSRTAIVNQLQAMARSFGLPRFLMKSKSAADRFEPAQRSPDERKLLDSRFAVFAKLNEEIKQVEALIEAEAEHNELARRLKTHPGIGSLTAVCLVHTLGDVQRFRRKEEVTAFVGLVPLDQSSGEKKRIGQISKFGSRLLRFLLGQSAQRSTDQKLREFYQRVSRRRGKPKAKVATARKLLERCYIMLRDGIDYEEFRRRGEVGVPECPGKEDCS